MLLDSVRKYLPDTINVIDIGCHKAHWLDVAQSMFNIGHSIGIDPCDYGVGSRYNRFYEIAIVNDGRKETKFNEYVEPGCNSTLDMNKDIIVHSRELDGWYVGWPVEITTNVRNVKCRTLYDVIQENWEVLPIHFMKIDTQGLDIHVVKSADALLKDIWFIQLECVSSHREEIIMYKGQQLMEQDIIDMKDLGFEVLAIEDHAAGASPEADIVFYNKKKISL